ncbi:uncharacterized protein LOC125809994 [Solanum verrucosum]|uniref:uncharacterized protein LOC125809994 n=1 Tax=Solanum verrucosum TaxID=315347 RepID=UPI0020D00ED0|nr:uncharacterized protein LOC125809994 [Solanum verrucosum]
MSSIIHELYRAKMQIIMPPRRAVRGRPAGRNVDEQELPNAPEVQPQGEVTNAEFREAIWMLSQAMTNQFNQLSRYASKIVADMRNRMNLFVTGLSRLSSKEGRAAMLIEDMEISRLMVYVQQVEEEKLRDMEEFRNKKAKTGNESEQQKGSGNQGNKAQSSSVAPPGRVSPRGATSGTGGGTNRLYAIMSRQEQENSPDVTDTSNQNQHPAPR